MKIRLTLSAGGVQMFEPRDGPKSNLRAVAQVRRNSGELRYIAGGNAFLVYDARPFP